MTIFFSFLPIITVAIFMAFFGYLMHSHEKDEERKLKHQKRKNHNNKVA